MNNLVNKKLIIESQEYRGWQGQVFLHILHSTSVAVNYTIVWLTALTQAVLIMKLQIHIKLNKKSLADSSTWPAGPICVPEDREKSESVLLTKSLCTVCWHAINAWVSSPLPTGKDQHVLSKGKLKTVGKIPGKRHSL